jgi:hypothetical protein
VGTQIDQKYQPIVEYIKEKTPRKKKKLSLAICMLMLLILSAIDIHELKECPNWP